MSNDPSMFAAGVTVYCGANTQCLDLKGKTIEEAITILAEVMNIPEGAQIVVDGENMKRDYVLHDGNRLEFIKPSGQKGFVR